ncbi:MAG: hypothetical protein WCH83_09590, partial [Alphaproteobacteria bacterium]
MAQTGARPKQSPEELEARAARLFSGRTANAFDVAGGAGVATDRRRGRGSISNTSGRYEKQAREAFDDVWDSLDELEPFATTVVEEKARRIITRNDIPDLNFDRSINPYRRCAHGSSFCFARRCYAYSV